MLSPATLEAARAIARERAEPLHMGRVARLTGLSIEACVPDARVGDILEVYARHGDREVPVDCEVVGFRDDVALAIPMAETTGIAPGTTARLRRDASTIGAGDALLGRGIDAFGRPIDGGPPIVVNDRIPLSAPPVAIDKRGPVCERFDTGVRVIDALLTCGCGQRVGIFAGAGVGKSVLVEQITRQSTADVTIMGLVGERGREVQELMSSALDERSIVVAATSDRSPMERVRGARVATALAEYFAARGKNVLLVVDSLTRYAMALREIGLAVGEPPATKGYPPSVFAELPKLLERVAPLRAGGSITGFYTVLVEGDDMSDPVADSARSLLDAHLVLSRDIAARGHFPAIDVLVSASRVARQVTDGDTQELVRKARALLTKRNAVEELRSFGAYSPGADVDSDRALALGIGLDQWSRQSPEEHSDYSTAMVGLQAVLEADD